MGPHLLIGRGSTRRLPARKTRHAAAYRVWGQAGRLRAVLITTAHGNTIDAGISPAPQRADAPIAGTELACGRRSITQVRLRSFCPEQGYREPPTNFRLASVLRSLFEGPNAGAGRSQSPRPRARQANPLSGRDRRRPLEHRAVQDPPVPVHLVVADDAVQQTAIIPDDQVARLPFVGEDELALGRML